MRILIPLKNPRTNELKRIKLGFSWTILFLSGFFGIPLFLRRLYVLGAIYVVYAFVYTVLMAAGSDNAKLMATALNLTMIPVVIWMAIKGNEFAAKAYINDGWEFAEPDSDFTRMAKSKWGFL